MSDTGTADIDKDDFTDAVETFPRKFKLSKSIGTGSLPVRHLGK